LANIQAYKLYNTAIVAELLIMTDTIYRFLLLIISNCPRSALTYNNPVLALRTPRMQDIA
tara:strand:+ start:936 stop:1115 length:180 start_codon:yes stop_codon:yes gene_type:complete